MMIALFLGARMWSSFVIDLQAAVRFEVRLAEDRPAPGLREAKVSGSNRSVYLHDEVIVTNSDIAQARVVQGSGPSQYGVSVEFNASGAEKMRRATRNHIGRPVAILLDGQVVVAPALRTLIGASAVISGDYPRE
jgi:preprotein translocase subunit SecD